MKTLLRYIWVLFPVVTSIASWRWMPFTYWEKAQEGLLFFLGLIVAALVPVIMATANFSRNNKILCLDQVKRLNEALERQQSLWIGLLALNFIAALMLIICIGFSKAIANSFPKLLIEYGGTDSILSGVLSLFVVGAIVRGMFIMPGVISLQKLQSEISVKVVEEHFKEVGKKKQILTVGKVSLPDGYGDVIEQDKDQ